MKTIEVRWQRLLAAARKAPAVDAPPAMPDRLKTRVLAHWRAGAAAHETWHALALVFRRALVCAAVVMLASIAWSLGTPEPENDVALANYELRADVMP